MKVMNEFWTQLGFCAKDLVFTDEGRSFNGFGDVSEFIAYGEERCKWLGIQDDADVADFLFQAFEGEVQTWYSCLPPHVQGSWFLLRMALFEEFGEGYVMQSLKWLCQEGWQVAEFQQAFNQAWKVYEQVSFFRYDFLIVLKSQILEMHYQAQLEWTKVQSMQEMKDAGIHAPSILYLSTDEVVDGWFKEPMVSGVYVPRRIHY